MNTSDPVPPGRSPLATPAELAKFLRIQETTLANWRWKKVGPPWSKTGRHVRYSWLDIDTWIAEQKPPQPKDSTSEVP